MTADGKRKAEITEKVTIPGIVERTNIRYRGINFVVELQREYCDTSDPSKGVQYWARIEWRRGRWAEQMEQAARLVNVPDYRFEFFTSYTGRGRHRSMSNVFEEANAYIKGTIDLMFDRAVEEARKRADRAEQIINDIKEELTQREWEK